MFFPLLYLRISNRPNKEGLDAELEKKAEQENNEAEQIEKELEKDKVCDKCLKIFVLIAEISVITFII